MMVQMKLNCHNFFNHAIEIEFHQYGTVMCMYMYVRGCSVFVVAYNFSI